MTASATQMGATHARRPARKRAQRVGGASLQLPHTTARRSSREHTARQTDHKRSGRAKTNSINRHPSAPLYYRYTVLYIITFATVLHHDDPPPSSRGSSLSPPSAAPGQLPCLNTQLGTRSKRVFIRGLAQRPTACTFCTVSSHNNTQAQILVQHTGQSQAWACGRPECRCVCMGLSPRRSGEEAATGSLAEWPCVGAWA